MSIANEQVLDGARARAERGAQPISVIELEARRQGLEERLKHLMALATEAGRRNLTVTALRLLKEARPVREELKDVRARIAQLEGERS